MKNIFVGNLSFGTSEEAVRALFEAHGTVDRVNIVRDRDTGQPRGFGFVEMTNDNEGTAAINALNGRDLDGTTGTATGSTTATLIIRLSSNASEIRASSCFRI